MTYDEAKALVLDNVLLCFKGLVLAPQWERWTSPFAYSELGNLRCPPGCKDTCGLRPSQRDIVSGRRL